MSRPTRQQLTAVVLLALVAMVMTFAVVRHDALAALDGPWRDWVIAHRDGTMTDVMVAASGFGSTPSLVVIALAVAAWLAWRGRRADSWLVVLGSAGVLLLGPVLKVLVERPRPELREHVVAVDSWSYPSGHSLNSMAVLGLLTVLAIRERPGAARRVLLGAVGGLLVLMVGFSRVYLGVHWPSDVLAGWLIGALWITVCLTVTALTRGNTPTSGSVRRSS
jgi:membrane-associated phospholipid phosphatase